MLTHGNHQHTFPNFARVQHVVIALLRYGNPARKKRNRQQRRSGAYRHQSSRRKPCFPPTCPLVRKTFWKPVRDLPPNFRPVFFAWIGHRHRVQRVKHRFNAIQFHAALAAFLQMRRNRVARLHFAFSVSKQFFFRYVFHDSVPTALAVPRHSANGFRACRNFCTARNTVFFAALVFDFSTAAISSIPQPSQCRITIAVRSAGLNASNASFIFVASSTLVANRSGEGAESFTRLSGSISVSLSADLVGASRRDSSFFFCRNRSIA